MLLSIDKTKIEKELAETSLAYTVSSFNLEEEIIKPNLPSAEICSTLIAIPPELERARERLLILRERVINSGRKPLSSDELEREIDETRGRCTAGI